MTFRKKSILNEGYYSCRIRLWPNERRMFGIRSLGFSNVEIHYYQTFSNKDAIKTQKVGVFLKKKEYLQCWS